MHFKGKTFLILLGLSALFVEACAAFFSVYGLSKLFSGATIAVILMAGSLEIAKVVTASFLYRRWKFIHWFMKTYLTLGVVVLVGITSMGIYGFLSNAFQGATVGLELEASKIVLYEEQLETFKADKKVLGEEKQELLMNMNRDLEALNFADSTNYLLINTRKRQVRNVYLPEIQKRDVQILSLNEKIDTLTVVLGNLRTKTISTGVEVGPIIFVARAFDVGVETVVKYLIFVFIAVFDPLAVALVIATNSVWMDMQKLSVPRTELPKPDVPKESKLSKLKERTMKLFTSPQESPPVPSEVVDTPVPLVAVSVNPVAETVMPSKSEKSTTAHDMPKSLDLTGTMPRSIG